MTSDSPQINPAERDNSIIVLKVCVIILTVCAIGAVSAVLHTVIPPLFLGLLLYFLVSPVIEYLDTHHIPRWLAYILLCAMGAAAVFGTWRLIEVQSQNLTARIPQYRKRLHQALNPYVQTLGLQNKEGRSDGPKKSQKDKPNSLPDERKEKVDSEAATLEDAVPVSMALDEAAHVIVEQRAGHWSAWFSGTPQLTCVGQWSRCLKGYLVLTPMPATTRNPMKL